MPLKVHITNRAARDIERIAEWWFENRQAAPGAVRKDLRAMLNVLKYQPGIGQKFEDAMSENVRRIHLDRIGHWIYYRVSGESLEVLSLWSSHRGSDPTL